MRKGSEVSPLTAGLRSSKGPRRLFGPRAVALAAFAFVLSSYEGTRAASSCADPNLLAGTGVPTNASPQQVAVGDWNRDGHLDLAVTDSDATGSVSILLGNGSGVFPSGSTITGLGNAPDGIAAADFDRDGILDLVVAVNGANKVRFLKGNAGGTFTLQAAADITIGSPRRVAVGDFNRDGWMDFAVTSYSGDRVFVYTNNKAGGFTFSTNPVNGNVVTGKTPVALVVGDFNRDGLLDVASASESDGNVSILLGDGAGGIAEASRTALGGTTPRGIAAADLNGDGILDVVTADAGSKTVSVLRGNGAGGMTLTGTLSTGLTTSSVVVTDIDRDGIPDVVASSLGDGSLYAFLGKGSFNFQAGVALTVNGGPLGLALGDFTTDDKDDLAVALSTGNQALPVLNATGLACANQSFSAPRAQPANTSPLWVAKGDFNGDGHADVVMGNDLSGSPDAVTVFLSSGAGLTTSGIFGLGAGTQLPAELAVADIDGDGRPDVITPNNGSNNLSILPGLGSGSLGAPILLNLGGATGPQSVATGDFNGDGKIDIAVSNGSTNNVTVFLNTGGPGVFTFAPPVNYVTPAALGSIKAGDVNNDGKVDLVVTMIAPTNRLLVFLGVGDGTFNSPLVTPSVPMSGNNPVDLVLGDFNGDGFLDVATANSSSNDVSVLIGSGIGTFTEMMLRPVGAGPQTLTLGDFNGDGRLDIATANTTASTVSVILSTGVGAFGAASSFPATAPPVGIVAGDFNADGEVDIVTSGPGPGTALLFAGKGDGTFVSVPTFTTVNGGGLGTNPATAVVADFNRDGKLDLVTANHSGTVSVLFGNGAGGFAAPTVATFGSNYVHAVVGDFDRDGIPDLAVADTTAKTVQILKGNGAGGFVSLSTASTGSPKPVMLAAGDFDRDGDLDLAVALDDGSVSIFRNNGGGGLGAGAFTNTGPLVGGVPLTAIVAGDFDRDGVLDLAVTLGGTTNSVYVLHGNGAALTFSVSTSIPLGSGTSPASLVAADFNDDGALDILTANKGTGTLSFLRNTGSGFFSAPVTTATVASPVWLTAADFNQDGIIDVAVASQSGDVVSVHTGTGSGTFSGPVSYGVNGAAFSLAVGDFNGDTKPDIVATNSIGNTLSVLLDSNCVSKRFEVTQGPICNAALTPFATQPWLKLTDEGSNPILCGGGLVTAALVPGLGTAGAVLNGAILAGVATAPAPDQGFAKYTSLSVDRNGTGYEITFSHNLSSVIPARTNPFTVGLDVNINGPATVCAGAPSAWSTLAPAFVVPPVYDAYKWSLSGTYEANTSSFTLGPQPANNYVMQLDATLDACMVTKTTPFQAQAPLSAVAVTTAGGSTAICTTCSGTVMTATETGGGPIVSRQWGYRTTSGGPITSIAGATGLTYTLTGANFPAPGSYFVVVTSTPTCGSPVVSNEIPVTIFAVVAGPQLPVFTARSRTTENQLEWLNPPVPYYATLVRAKASTAGTSDCTFPTDPGDGILVALQAGVAGTHDSSLHTPLLNDTTYCYRAFVATAPYTYAVPGKDLKARPFDTSGNVAWAFSTGVSTLSPPGMGVGVIHIVANDGTVHTVGKGATGGLWAPAPWKPPVLPLPSQTGRPGAIPVSVAGSNPVLFISSQDGHLYTFGAANGNFLWSPAPVLGDAVQAAPSGVFKTFGGTQDLVFVGSTNAATPNSFYGLRLADGIPAAPGWTYSGDVSNGQIGIVTGQAAVDYASHRVYFTSRTFGASLNTVWCVDFNTGLAVWAKPFGNISQGVTLRGTRLYVALDGGGVMAIDTATGNQVWTAAYPTPTTVKGFVYADRLTTNLYFSTATGIYSVADSGAGPSGWTDNWGGAIALTNPSTPVFIPGDDKVYTGGIGRLYRRQVANGLAFDEFVLGDGSAVVGSPTIDLSGGFVYVGSDAGVVYAIKIP